MAINTYSAFSYGHTVTSLNNVIDFDEGSGELSAVLNIGEYTIGSYFVEVARAMTAAGGTYTVTVDRDNGFGTITKSTGTFKFLGATGTHVGNSALPLMGFTLVDTAFATSQTSTVRSGSIWNPQFKGQDYVPFNHQQSAVDGTVKKSASGRVEAVKFGNQKIMDINFLFITDIDQTTNNLIISDSSGVANAQAFLEYAITKGDMEFYPNKDNKSDYYNVILESTPESQDGLSFKLKEEYGRGLPGYYQTGVLKFRLL